MTSLVSSAADLRRAVRAWALDARLVRERPRRPVLVGLSPADGSEDWPALMGGLSCSRLAGFAGRRWTWIVSEFERRNVRAAPGGAFGGSPRRWDLRGRVVVLLGREAQEAVGAVGDWYRWHLHADAATGLAPNPATVEPEILHDTWHEETLRDLAADLARGYTVVAAIPHPSGLNRVYNEVGQRNRAGRVLREAVDLAASVSTIRTDCATMGREEGRT